jgi:hypothetical protein
MAEIIVAVIFCIAIILFIVIPPVVMFIRLNHVPHISGPTTEEGDQEWLDEYQQKFLSWGENLEDEPILLPSERRKH